MGATQKVSDTASSVYDNTIGRVIRIFTSLWDNTIGRVIRFFKSLVSSDPEEKAVGGIQRLYEVHHGVGIWSNAYWRQVDVAATGALLLVGLVIASRRMQH